MKKKLPVRFDHQKLAVYQRALDFVAQVKDALEQTQPYHDEKDQLARASTSITRNIAEGAGEFAPKEKCRFYRMARRSATECVSSIDNLYSVDKMPFELADKLSAELEQIVRMLVGLIHANERDAPSLFGQGQGQGQGQGHRPGDA